MLVADYMARCLFDPVDGYYTHHVRLGAEGDFITAPLVSQMFGEMIGVWVAQTWQAMGAPSQFRLIEIGGGDGTLMSDIRRVMIRVPGLADAARVTLVEPSERLRTLQAKTSPGAAFYSDLDSVPDDLPVVVIANEVLDCLPARQYVRTEDGWMERCVGVIDSDLAFGLVPASVTPDVHAEPGDLIEVSAAQNHFAARLATLVKSATGAAVLIDYGRDCLGPGDTLQALHRHVKHNPLAAPGEHDLTVWADFPAVAAQVSARVKASPIRSQAAFLTALGIEARLSTLQSLHPHRSDELQRQYDRLISPDQMGALFKVLGMAYPPSLPLFALED